MYIPLKTVSAFVNDSIEISSALKPKIFEVELLHLAATLSSFLFQFPFLPLFHCMM